MTSVWDLIKLRDYEAACRQADREYEAGGGSLVPLRNKVLALLALGRADEAEEICSTLIRRASEQVDTDSIFLGVARWITGRTSLAMDAWRLATEAVYTDAAGGVEVQLLLYFAGVRLGIPDVLRNAEEELTRLVHSNSPRRWPVPLARFVLANLSEADLLEGLAPIEGLRQRQECQVQFFRGVVAFRGGDAGTFRRQMERATLFEPFALLKAEYFLARFERTTIESRGDGLTL